MTQAKKGPLDGIVVLDLTIAIAGPYTTTLLAAMGATVITVEYDAKGGGREQGPYMGRDGISLSRKYEDDVGLISVRKFRNKNCITLNMKKPEAKAIFVDLVRRADIMVQNFSLGAAARMGADYETVHKLNPRLVYTSISGFGQDETGGSGKAIDTAVQGLSGIMMVTGDEGGPAGRVGVPVADLTTPLYAVIGTLAALQQAQRTGQGQHVDVTMMGSVLAMIAIDNFPENEFFGISNRSGARSAQYVPLGVYEAADGPVTICAGGDVRTFELLKTMGREDLITDPRFATREGRARNNKLVDDTVEAWTRTLPADEVVRLMDKALIPSSRVRGPVEALRDERAHERGEVVRLAHPKYGATHEVFGPGLPMRFSEASAGLDTWASAYGEQNDKIYGDFLGYSPEKIAELRAAEVI